VSAAVTTASTGLRERRKAEARKAITEAALALFLERGFAHVTVDEIADRADVSRRSFFRYFPTKEAVAFERRSTQLERFREALARHTEQDVREVLRAALAELAEDYRRNKSRILRERALFASARELLARDLELDRELELVIVEAVLARSPHRAADEREARLFAACAMGVMHVVIDEWAATRGELDMLAVGLPALSKIEDLLPRRPRRPRATP